MIQSTGQMPDAIIFDLDNTLCTFTDAKHAACRAVIEYLGIGDAEELFRYFLRPDHGFEDPRHIHDYIHDLGVFTPEMASYLTNLFDEIKLAHINPYPGVIQGLSAIFEKGISMAIVTDAASGQAIKRIERCGLSDFFRILVTPDISGKRKPDHYPFLYAINRLQTPASNIWLVGDSIRREITPGIELGYTTVYARYGDWTNTYNGEKPTYAIDSFPELLPLLGISP